MQVTELTPAIFQQNEGMHRTATFRWILQHLYGAGPKALRAVDLGAGPCIFSRICAEGGFDVTAVDGRLERVPADLGRVKFVRSDVRDFDVTEFDLVLVLGLLYHLTLEDQIDLLSRAGRKSTVIIDTQVHFPHLVVEAACRERCIKTRSIVERDGFSGIIFPEVENAMASIGNTESWWHTEPSLLRVFESVGFGEVFKVEPPYVSKYGGRKWYVCRA